MEKFDESKMIQEDPDYIHAPKYGNSLQKLLAKIDKECENHAIGRMLLLPEERVEEIYQESIVELRKEMVDEEGSEDG